MGNSASREKFLSATNSLISSTVSSSDGEFWDELWKLGTSVEEVFQVLTPTKIRSIRARQFPNLTTLFTQAVAQLCQIVETPYNIYFDQALNCVRVLTRLVPFLLEDVGTDYSPPDGEAESEPLSGEQVREIRRQVEVLCWGVAAPASPAASPAGSPQQPEGGQEDGREPLALLSVHAAMHMLFLPQFTCDYFEENDEEDDEPEAAPMDPKLSVQLGNLPDDAADGSPPPPPPPSAPSSTTPLPSTPPTSPHAAPASDLRSRLAVPFPSSDAPVAAAGGSRRAVSLAPSPPSIIWHFGPGVYRSAKQLKQEELLTKKKGVEAAEAAAAEAQEVLNDKKRSKAKVKDERESDRQNKALEKATAANSAYDKNRVEVLRLLLAVCSEQLFLPPAVPNAPPPTMRWMAVACGADAPNASTLFFSLLNTVLSFDPVGIGIPYGGVVGTSVPKKLMELSAQVLVVLLDFGRRGQADGPTDVKTGYPLVDPEDSARPGYNVFRTLLARLHGEYELTFCFEGFTRLLNNVHESNNTYLPGSVSGIECYQEVLILLWKFLEENSAFLDHVLSDDSSCDVNELVVPICYLMYEARRDESRTGLVHICTFILLKLSGNREFGVQLNKPFRKHLPIQLPLFQGGHCDLVVVVLNKMVTDGCSGI
ncbi:hypothetical protein TeGR_g2701, partial [Tetraparma gracilis]